MSHAYDDAHQNGEHSPEILEGNKKMQHFDLNDVKILYAIAKKVVYCECRQKLNWTKDTDYVDIQNKVIDTKNKKKGKVKRREQIAPDCIQAAAATLYDYFSNYGLQPFDIAGYKPSGDTFTPFSKAMDAVEKVIRDDKTMGMTGTYAAIYNADSKRIDLSEDNERYFRTHMDDYSKTEIMGIFTEQDREIAGFLMDGYNQTEIAGVLKISKGRVSQKVKRIKAAIEVQ